MRHVLEGLGALLVSTVVLGGCSRMAIRTDWDETADFGGLRTWAWVPGEKQPTGEPRIDNPLLRGRIRAAVEAEMAAKGFERGAPETCDFWVDHHLAVDTELAVDTIDSYHRYAYGPGWSEVRVREYQKGTLLVDFILREGRRLVWRGSASARLRETSSPEAESETLREAVRLMLERYPPGR